MLFNDLSGCAQRAVDTFFGVRRAGGCTSAGRAVDPTDVPPTRIGQVDPLVGLPGRRGRTVRAALLTLQDGELHAPDSGRAGGLRGGYVAASTRSLSMHDVLFVPGVRVSAVERGGPAHLSVAGPAASRAHLLVTRGGVVTGVVGGRRVRLASRAPSPAARADGSRGRRRGDACLRRASVCRRPRRCAVGVEACAVRLACPGACHLRCSARALVRRRPRGWLARGPPAADPPVPRSP